MSAVVQWGDGEVNDLFNPFLQDEVMTLHGRDLCPPNTYPFRNTHKSTRIRTHRHVRQRLQSRTGVLDQGHACLKSRTDVLNQGHAYLNHGRTSSIMGMRTSFTDGRPE